jgi:hypothetical protein
MASDGINIMIMSVGLKIEDMQSILISFSLCFSSDTVTDLHVSKI